MELIEWSRLIAPLLIAQIHHLKASFPLLTLSYQHHYVAYIQSP